MGRGLIVAVTLICFTGCSWTATVARTDALDNEAEIEQSDADALYLRARNGRLHRIERHSVASIDHPGNVEMIVGAILIGLGVMIAADQSDGNRDVVAPLLIIYGGSGLALILSGMIRYIPSLRAAWAFQSADPPVKLMPPGAVYPPPPAAFPPPPAAFPPPPAPAAPPPPPPPAQQPPAEEQPEVIPDAT